MGRGSWLSQLLLRHGGHRNRHRNYSTAASFAEKQARQQRADTWGSISMDQFAIAGNRCIETLAAGPAIARRARQKLEENPNSVLWEMANGELETVTSEMVGRAHALNDFVAKEVMRETLDLFAYWLGSIIDLLEPEAIVIGGGVCSLLAPFFEEIRERWRGTCINPHPLDTPLLLAHFGEDAGIAGAAALCD